jgi:DNA-binding response OmpR family regulator
MSKVLIIEDEPKIQQIVKAYLEKEDFEVFLAGDGVKGLEMAREIRPDLVILDLMLPKLPGEELLSRLRQISDVPVLILSAKSSEEERIFGLQIGADDYLVKPFSPRELVARVQARLRRSGGMTAPTAQTASFNNGQFVMDTGKHEVRVREHSVTLTPTEFKLLALLIQTPGQVLSRAQLVEQVQGYSFDGYDRTIDSHVKNLRQKIEANPAKPVFILTVFGVGYRFGGERD